MKKLIKLFATVLFCFIMCSNVAFAEEDAEWKLAEKQAFANKSSQLLPKGVKRAKDIAGVARGKYIGSSCVEISNEGYGVIGVYADTLAHVAVKKIRMNIYLDRWDKANEEWVPIKDYEFTYTSSDDETLSDASEYFTIKNQPTGYYYRLRGLHGVWPFSGGVETQGTMTDGLMITDGPAL